MMYFNIKMALFLQNVVAISSIRCLLTENGVCSKTESNSADPLKETLQRRFLSNSKITCNDGTQSGYYIRENPRSKLWIIYLEGGLFCHNEETCVTRMNQSHFFSMTSSKMWAVKRHGDGLLNTKQGKNPLFWNANHVYIPYCSSDLWVGNIKRSTTSGDIAFHGSRVIMSVVDQLFANDWLKASEVILAGSSSGGIGVLQNIDRVADFLRKKSVTVRGVIDSAWFLDGPMDPNCQFSDKTMCDLQSLFKAATQYWNSMTPVSCTQAHKCMFADNVIKTLKTPVFVFQWLFDTVQIMADNRGLVTDPHQLFQPSYKTYLNKLGVRTRTSLRSTNDKHGYFAPSCISHTALTSSWVFDGISIRGKTLNEALDCWFNNSTACKYRLAEVCPLMACSECPAIRNPYTGEELRAPLMNIKSAVLDQASKTLKILNVLSRRQRG